MFLTPSKELLGIYRRCMRGHATDEKVREAGTNGGVVSALLIYALEQGVIDGTIVTGMSEDQRWRAVPKIATTRAEIIQAAGSKYMFVSNNALLNEAILDRHLGRIGIVGLPCHIHGLRKLQLSGKLRKIRESIAFTIGLYCASMPYFECLKHLVTELFEVPSLDAIAKLEYRGGKWPGVFRVTTRKGEIKALPYGSIFYSFSDAFKSDRCVMCRDFSSELADVSVGGYSDPRLKKGLSSMILRTDLGENLVNGAIETGYIEVSPMKSDFILGNTGFESKMHGAGYILEKRRKFGWPVPDFHYPTDFRVLPRKLLRQMSCYLESNRMRALST